MKKIMIVGALMVAAFPLQTVQAAEETGRNFFNWQQFISIIQRLKEQNQAKQAYESVICSGPDGTAVEFSTSGAEGRDLISLVKVKVENRMMTFSSSQISNYYNADDRMAMDVFKKSATDPYFSLRLDLAPTVSPRADEVATHSGTVAIDLTGYSAVPHKISCGTFKKGAGLLKPQTGSSKN